MEVQQFLDWWRGGGPGGGVGLVIVESGPKDVIGKITRQTKVKMGDEGCVVGLTGVILYSVSSDETRVLEG